MKQSQQIRVKALGLIQDGDRLFVSENYEPTKQKHYYRALGGSVEFGESSLETLKREFLEELQAELINIEYLCCIENRFIYLNQPQHEIIQLYRCDFADRQFYEQDPIQFIEGTNEIGIARWIHCDRFTSGELWLVPEACLNYLQKS